MRTRLILLITCLAVPAMAQDDLKLVRPGGTLRWNLALPNECGDGVEIWEKMGKNDWVFAAVAPAPVEEVTLGHKISQPFIIKTRCYRGSEEKGPWSPESITVRLHADHDANKDGCIGVPDFSDFKQVWGMCSDASGVLTPNPNKK